MLNNLRFPGLALLLAAIASSLISCEDSLVPKPSGPISDQRQGQSAVPSTDTSSPIASLNPGTPSVNSSPGSLTPTASPTGSSSGSPSGALSSVQPAGDIYQVIDEQRKPQFTVKSSQTFSTAELPQAKVNFQPQALLTVLQNTRGYLQRNSIQDGIIGQPGILASQGVSAADVVRTLDFAIETLQADIKANRSPRLQDAAFIRQNFRVIKWRAQNPQKADQEQIRITKYAVFSHPGSKTKTDTYNTALYALKDPLAKAATYTKQEVLAGIYEPGGKAAGAVQPIAYLTRDGLEEALMEGTILIKFTDGTQGFFNVDRSNEIPYVKGLDRKEQKRYWYFQPVTKIKGYGYTISEKIEIEPGVTFAGDVLNIGLGKLVAVGNGSNLRLGVVADTGGAFLPNLYQLDWLAGIFNSKAEFQQAARAVPEYANAYFLIRK
jgi:hypothetical protein